MAWVQRGRGAILQGAWCADPVPTHNELVCEWISDGDPKPVDLVVSFFADAVPVTGFPTRQSYFPAGSTFHARFHTQRCGFLKLELGNGVDTRVVYMDLGAGRFALGGQKSVRVSAWLWGAAGYALAGTVSVQAALVPADGTGGYLPFTIPLTAFPALTSQDLNVPTGALYVDLAAVSAFPYADPAAPKMRLIGNSMLERDLSVPTFYPPWSPVDIRTEVFLTFENFAATTCTGEIRFWCK